MYTLRKNTQFLRKRMESKNTCYFFFLSFSLFRATLMAYGGSQSTGAIRATAAGLHQSHSNAGSEPHLRPTPQLTAKLDPYPTEQDQGSNLIPHSS